MLKVNINRFITYWITALVLVSLGASSAFANLNLKKIQVTSNGEIQLQFDGKPNLNQIKTEFNNDIIQINLTDVSVYPAKVMSLNEGGVTKIFAYQYSPKTVRTRLTVEGKAEDYRGKVQFKTSGKNVNILIPNRAVASTNSESKAKESAVPVLETAEKKLLEQVVQSEVTKAESPKTPAFSKNNSKSSSEPKPIMTTSRVSGLILFMLGFLGLAYALVRRGKKNSSANPMGASIGSLMSKWIPSSNKSMMQVISTQSLGPKKSIQMVKIQDRILVLGISNENINLITEFEANEDKVPVSSFAEGLKKFENGESQPSKNISLKGRSLFGDLFKTEMSQAPKPQKESKPLFVEEANEALFDEPASEVMNTASSVQSSQQLSQQSLNRGPTFSSYQQKIGSQAYGESRPNKAPASSQIRAQIKSRVEGMKQL